MKYTWNIYLDLQDIYKYPIMFCFHQTTGTIRSYQQTMLYKKILEIIPNVKPIDRWIYLKDRQTKQSADRNGRITWNIFWGKKPMGVTIEHPKLASANNKTVPQQALNVQWLTQTPSNKTVAQQNTHCTMTNADAFKLRIGFYTNYK